MKKILIFVIILAISLCFISCQKETPDDLVDTDKESSFLESEELTTPSVDTDAAVEIPQGERPLKTMPSVSEYEDFISSNRLPENFVYYDNIKEFGEFKRLVILSESRLNDYSHYVYTLVADVGFEFMLYVLEGTPQESQDSILTSKTTADMRQLDSEQTCIFVKDNIKYQYVLGKLHSIKWTSGELNFTLYSNSGLSTYNPSDSNGVVAKLLNINTCSTAFNNITFNATK